MALLETLIKAIEYHDDITKKDWLILDQSLFLLLKNEILDVEISYFLKNLVSC